MIAFQRSAATERLVRLKAGWAARRLAQLTAASNVLYPEWAAWWRALLFLEIDADVAPAELLELPATALDRRASTIAAGPFIQQISPLTVLTLTELSPTGGRLFSDPPPADWLRAHRKLIQAGGLVNLDGSTDEGGLRKLAFTLGRCDPRLSVCPACAALLPSIAGEQLAHGCFCPSCGGWDDSDMEPHACVEYSARWWDHPDGVPPAVTDDPRAAGRHRSLASRPPPSQERDPRRYQVLDHRNAL